MAVNEETGVERKTHEKNIIARTYCCEALRNETQALKDCCETLRNEIQTLKDCCETLRNEIHSMKDCCQVLQSENHELRERVRQLESKCIDVKGRGRLRPEIDPLTEIDFFCLKLRNKAPQVVF